MTPGFLVRNNQDATSRDEPPVVGSLTHEHYLNDNKKNIHFLNELYKHIFVHCNTFDLQVSELTTNLLGDIAEHVLRPNTSESRTQYGKVSKNVMTKKLEHPRMVIYCNPVPVVHRRYWHTSNI